MKCRMIRSDAILTCLRFKHGAAARAKDLRSANDPKAGTSKRGPMDGLMTKGAMRS
jgi:hypothetical protein